MPLFLLGRRSERLSGRLVTDNKLLRQKKIIRVGQLHGMFVKQVELTENIDASGYRVFRHKRRLQRDSPSLSFIALQLEM